MSAKITTTAGQPRDKTLDDGRDLIWFDIDNCLYSRKLGIDTLMGEKIRSYFTTLGLDDDEATRLHKTYYRDYGLAIRGLVEHHKVDPAEYDLQCDSALPLGSVLTVNESLQRLLGDIDRTKYRVWCLTNAQANHAVRVLKLVGLSEAFDGIVSCDYSAPDFTCKPQPEFFAEAIAAGGMLDPSRNYFVDDSAANIRGASTLNWGHSVLYDEQGDESVKLEGFVPQGKLSVIRDMEELRTVWQEIFMKQKLESH